MILVNFNVTFLTSPTSVICLCSTTVPTSRVGSMYLDTINGSLENKGN